MKRVEMPKGPNIDELIQKYEQSNLRLKTKVDSLMKVVQPILDEQEKLLAEKKKRNENAKNWKVNWQKKLEAEKNKVPETE